MITISITDDYALIHSIVTHPRVYTPAVRHDAAPSADKWDIGSQYLCLLASDSGEPLGTVVMEPTPVKETWKAHLAFLPSAWGERCLEACRQLVSWLKLHVCDNIVAEIPEFNRLTISLVKRLGFVERYKNIGQFKKDGKAVDGLVYSI